MVAAIAIVTWGLVIVLSVLLLTGRLRLEAFASLGYLGIAVISLINGAVPFPGPSQLATFVAGSALSPIAVGVVAGTAGAIGKLAVYMMGRTGFEALPMAVKERVETVGSMPWVRVGSTRWVIALFLLAAIPNPIFESASILSGALRMSLPRYFLPVLLGKIVRHTFTAFLGNRILSHVGL
jgi:membrane protein YqaA with SNARE-associated domain